jgi:hypothetical protein
MLLFFFLSLARSLAYFVILRNVFEITMIMREVNTLHPSAAPPENVMDPEACPPYPSRLLRGLAH